jgi:hypothetical protein
MSIAMSVVVCDAFSRYKSHATLTCFQGCHCHARWLCTAFAALGSKLGLRRIEWLGQRPAAPAFNGGIVRLN